MRGRGAEAQSCLCAPTEELAGQSHTDVAHRRYCGWTAGVAAHFSGFFLDYLSRFMSFFFFDHLPHAAASSAGLRTDDST